MAKVNLYLCLFPEYSNINIIEEQNSFYNYIKINTYKIGINLIGNDDVKDANNYLRQLELNYQKK